MTIQERETEFKKQVQEVGRLIYSQEMLVRFTEHWSEFNRAKGKAQRMKWELQKTWDTKKRLAFWARRNYDKIQCYLTEAEKSIMERKHSFAVSLEPYLEKYGRDTLNAFYRWWTQPENKKNPELLKWEAEEFWSLDTRLENWINRSNK